MSCGWSWPARVIDGSGRDNTFHPQISDHFSVVIAAVVQNCDKGRNPCEVPRSFQHEIVLCLDARDHLVLVIDGSFEGSEDFKNAASVQYVKINGVLMSIDEIFAPFAAAH